MARFSIVLTFYLTLAALSVYGQANFDSIKVHKIFSQKLSSYDVSEIWKSDPEDILGFIGSNYQRLQIHYTSITKDKRNVNTYLVKGKTKIKDTISTFEGTITINKVVENFWYDDNHIRQFMTDSLNNAVIEGDIYSSYSFKENPKQNHSGIFEGTIKSGFYLDKDYKIHYDDLNLMSDGYINNEFVGTWTSYEKKEKMTCNWGNKRIPDCGDLDEGAGEFVPNEKYRKNGWENYCWFCTYEELEKYQADKKLSRWWE
jgi:hypothetical protein